MAPYPLEGSNGGADRYLEGHTVGAHGPSAKQREDLPSIYWCGCQRPPPSTHPPVSPLYRPLLSHPLPSHPLPVPRIPIPAPIPPSVSHHIPITMGTQALCMALRCSRKCFLRIVSQGSSTVRDLRAGVGPPLGTAWPAPFGGPTESLRTSCGTESSWPHFTFLSWGPRIVTKGTRWSLQKTRNHGRDIHARPRWSSRQSCAGPRWLVLLLVSMLASP